MISRLFITIALAIACIAQSPVPADKASGKSAPASEQQPAVADPIDAAQGMLKSRKYAEATAAFRSIVGKDPAALHAEIGLMQSLLRSGKIEDAEDAGKKALAVLPNSPPIHAEVGDVAFRAGKFAEAEAEYRACLKLDDTSARGWFGLGRMYEMLSMRKHAKDAYANAHDFDPKDEQIFEHWLRLLSPAEALEAMKKWSGDHSDRESDYLKLLNAEVEKKPWVLVGEPKAQDIKMLPYGRHLAGVNDINRDGPLNISKGYGLEVKFNGRASAVLLVDTGAGGITIGRKLAEKAGAVKIANTFIFGIGDQGGVESYEAWIDKIVIGGVEFHNCIVTVSSKNDVADEAGLIGPNVFRKFLVTLDFQNWKLRLGLLPALAAANADSDDAPVDRYIAPEMQNFTRAYIFGHDLVIPVSVNDKGTGNFILDTGADLNIMNPRLASQVTEASNDHEYRMTGVSGKVTNVLTGKKAILQFSKMRVESHELPVFSTDNISASAGTEISGFIGIRTLVQMKMTIDYRDGLVDFKVYEFKQARE